MTSRSLRAGSSSAAAVTGCGQHGTSWVPRHWIMTCTGTVICELNRWEWIPVKKNSGTANPLNFFVELFGCYLRTQRLSRVRYRHPAFWQDGPVTCPDPAFCQPFVWLLLGIPLAVFPRKISPLRAPIAFFCVEPAFGRPGVSTTTFISSIIAYFWKIRSIIKGKTSSLLCMQQGPFLPQCAICPGTKNAAGMRLMPCFQEWGLNGSKWLENDGTGSVWGI